MYSCSSADEELVLVVYPNQKYCKIQRYELYRVPIKTDGYNRKERETLGVIVSLLR